MLPSSGPPSSALPLSVDPALIGPTPTSAPAIPGGGPARAAVNLNTPRVLVLNASYEPLHVTSAKRAITLLQYGVAEVLEVQADLVSAACF